MTVGLIVPVVRGADTPPVEARPGGAAFVAELLAGGMDARLTERLSLDVDTAMDALLLELAPVLDAILLAFDVGVDTEEPAEAL